jgi:hypothetical protein
LVTVLSKPINSATINLGLLLLLVEEAAAIATLAVTLLEGKAHTSRLGLTALGLRATTTGGSTLLVLLTALHLLGLATVLASNGVVLELLLGIELLLTNGEGPKVVALLAGQLSVRKFRFTLGSHVNNNCI